MIRTIHAEWTKFRTHRGALIALGAMSALMVGMSAFAASEQETNAVFGGDDDVVQFALAGIVFAELAAVVVGASLITSEYTTGMIRTTPTATQGRLSVLVAKVAVLVLATFPAALAASALAFAAAMPLLRDGGYVAPAYPPVSITDPAAARAVVGTALLLTAYALIALGIGTMLRHSGATIAAGIGIVFVPLLMLGLFPEHVRLRLEQFSPRADRVARHRERTDRRDVVPDVRASAGDRSERGAAQPDDAALRRGRRRRPGPLRGRPGAPQPEAPLTHAGPAVGVRPPGLTPTAGPDRRVEAVAVWPLSGKGGRGHGASA